MVNIHHGKHVASVSKLISSDMVMFTADCTQIIIFYLIITLAHPFIQKASQIRHFSVLVANQQPSFMDSTHN